MQAKPKTIINIAADYGIVLGALYCITFFGGLYAVRLPWLSVACLLAAVGVPVAVWIMLKNTWNRSLRTMPFSAMWTEGIVASAFGGILLALATFIYLKWVAPGIMLGALEHQADLWDAAATEQSKANARALRIMIENGAIPHPSEIALQLVCLVVFSGSLLTMLLSLLIRVFYKKH
ncbi:MAG: DUF4199 domain-containing protein [Muribaculaceae bacterium]|nr:DUF4199 domain-containing protein [Muribaculaceae bacterium]